MNLAQQGKWTEPMYGREQSGLQWNPLSTHKSENNQGLITEISWGNENSPDLACSEKWVYPEKFAGFYHHDSDLIPMIPTVPRYSSNWSFFIQSYGIYGNMTGVYWW